MLNYKTFTHSSDDRWVVMIHGAGGNIEVWHKQVAEFSRHLNLLLIDLAGHGESGGAEVFSHSFNFNVAADQIIEVLDHLNIKRAHFMGLSLGSIIVHAIANNYPNRVDTMVLAGAITHLSLKMRIIFEFVDMFKYIIPYRLIKTFLLNSIVPQTKYSLSKSMFRRSAEKVTYHSFMQWMRLLSSFDNYMTRLLSAEILTPTLYIMGEDDALCLSHVKKLVQQSGDNVSLVIIENAGHVCNIDNKQCFNKVSLDFINSNS